MGLECIVTLNIRSEEYYFPTVLFVPGINISVPRGTLLFWYKTNEVLKKFHDLPLSETWCESEVKS